ncbi:MAG: NAC family transcription factor [Candidatus Aminicenantia bacterium]
MRKPCCGRALNVKIINVDGMEVGLRGLDETFFEVYLLGIEDEELLKVEILKRVKEKNFMSKKYEPKYAEALLKEFKKFYETQLRESGKK